MKMAASTSRMASYQMSSAPWLLARMKQFRREAGRRLLIAPIPIAPPPPPPLHSHNRPGWSQDGFYPPRPHSPTPATPAQGNEVTDSLEPWQGAADRDQRRGQYEYPYRVLPNHTGSALGSPVKAEDANEDADYSFPPPGQYTADYYHEQRSHAAGDRTYSYGSSPCLSPGSTPNFGAGLLSYHSDHPHEQSATDEADAEICTAAIPDPAQSEISVDGGRTV